MARAGMAPGPEAEPKELVNLGPAEPLSTLATEFRFNASFVEKVEKLRRCGYTGWRRVRGDGNCFYRAVGFGLLEQLAVAAGGAQRERWALELRQRLEALHPPAEEAELAALAELLERIQRLATGGGWESGSGGNCGETALASLYSCMRDPGNPLDLALVRALRRLAADHLLKNASDDEAGGGISFDTICTAQGFAGVEDFCQRVVLPEGVEAEHVVIQALPGALGIGLRVAFLDRQGAAELPFCDYGSCEEEGGRPLVHVQLRPGHYDLLYFREQSVEEDSSGGTRATK